MKKNYLFIILMLFSIAPLYSMEEMIEKDKEDISIPSLDKDSSAIIEDFQKLLENNPTNNPEGLVTSYIFNTYDSNHSSEEIKKLLKIADDLKNGNNASDDAIKIGCLLENAGCNLIEHLASCMAGFNSVFMEGDFLQDSYCVSRAVPGGLLSYAKDAVYAKSTIPALKYTTYDQLDRYGLPCKTQQVEKLTVDGESTCKWLDSLNLQNEISGRVACALMAQYRIPRIQSEDARADKNKWILAKYLPDSSGVVVGTSDGRIISFNFDGKCFKGNKGEITALEPASSGKWLASAGSIDKEVKLYDLNTKDENEAIEFGQELEPKIKFARHIDTITALAFPHGDDTKLFSSSNDKTVANWDVNTGECIDSMQHFESVSHVVVSPDNYTAASTSNKTVYFIDPRVKQKNKGPCFEYPISSCAYTPAGLKLGIMGKGANGVCIYDIRAGKKDCTYLLSEAALKKAYDNAKKSTIQFSPCGTKVLLGFNKVCQLFDLRDTEHINMHAISFPGNCYDCSFASNGKEIAVVYKLGSKKYRYADPRRPALSRYHLYDEDNKEGNGFTAQMAVAMKIMRTAAKLGQKIKITNPLARRLMLPEVRSVLQQNQDN